MWFSKQTPKVHTLRCLIFTRDVNVLFKGEGDNCVIFTGECEKRETLEYRYVKDAMFNPIKIKDGLVSFFDGHELVFLPITSMKMFTLGEIKRTETTFKLNIK